MALIGKTTTIPTNTGKVLSVHGGVTTDLTKVISNHGGSAITVWEKQTFSGTKEFNYNGSNGTDGSVQEWVIPVSGNYQIEVYGAEGGYQANYKRAGGKGGYAKGTKYLTAGTKVYVCVGGYPGACYAYNTLSTYFPGGYNGGGCKMTDSDHTSYGTQGGGCTSVCINNNRGILKNYENYKSEILIVAAGGGGCGFGIQYIITDHNLDYSHGGSGGGTNGGDAISSYPTYDDDDDYDGNITVSIVKGATQSAGGYTDGWSNQGSFGQGKHADSWYSGSGGGGGYYGGGSGLPEDQNNGFDCSGSGGSGYIGGVLSGYMSNGARSGHGYAKFTLL